MTSNGEVRIMKGIKLTSFILSTMVTFTALSACAFRLERPDTAVDISPEEMELIETMQAEGKDPVEIAEALSSYEDENIATDEDNSADQISSVPCGSEIDTSAPEGNESEMTQTGPETTGSSDEAAITVASSPDPTKAPEAKATEAPRATEAPKTTEAPKATSTPRPTATTAPKATSTPKPTAKPTVKPTATPKPTAKPTAKPTTKPTSTPRPAVKPTATPKPTAKPTTKPTSTPRPTTKPTSTPKPTATPSPTTAPTYSFNSSKENELLRLINNLRKETAVEFKYTYYVPLKMDSTCQERVHTRCRELTDDFSHNSPSGDTGWAENIYWASWCCDAQNIFNKWYNSPGHYNNMIYCCCSSGGGSQKCGVGVMEYNGQLYAVLMISGFNDGTPPSSGYVAPAAPAPTEAPKATNTPTPVPTNTPTPIPTTAPTETSSQDESRDQGNGV